MRRSQLMRFVPGFLTALALSLPCPGAFANETRDGYSYGLAGVLPSAELSAGSVAVMVRHVRLKGELRHVVDLYGDGLLYFPLDHAGDRMLRLDLPMREVADLVTSSVTHGMAMADSFRSDQGLLVLETAAREIQVAADPGAPADERLSLFEQEWVQPARKPPRVRRSDPRSRPTELRQVITVGGALDAFRTVRSGSGMAAPPPFQVH